MADSLPWPAALDSIRLGWALIQSTWEGMVVASTLEIVLLLAGRRKASLRYVFCGLALAAMPVCLAVTYVSLEGAPGAAVAPAASANATQDRAEPLREPSAAFAFPPMMRSISYLGFRQMPAVDLNRWLPLLVMVWAAGVMLLSLRKAGGLMMLARWRKDEVHAPNEAISERCRRACAKIGVDPNRIYLGISNLIDVPMTMGWIRPVVLFPAALFSGLSLDEIEMLLAHELAHIRRCDYLVNLIQTGIETIFFYHPAAWWISRRMRQERENCCDDLVTSASGGVVAYARALLRLESLRLSRNVALAPAATGGSLVQRIQRLADEPPRQMETGHRSILAMGFSAAAVAVWLIGLPLDSTTPHSAVVANAPVSSVQPLETDHPHKFHRLGELDGSMPGLINKTELPRLAYLPVTGMNGSGLDGKEDVVRPARTGRAGISLTYSAANGTLTYKIGASVLHVQTFVFPEQVSPTQNMALGNNGINPGVVSLLREVSRVAPTFGNFAFSLRPAADVSPYWREVLNPSTSPPPCFSTQLHY